MAVVAMPKVKLVEVEKALPRGADAVCTDLRELLKEELYADVCFEVEGREVLAHVAILVARCDHFRRMFQSGMAESRADAAPSGDLGACAPATPVRRVQIKDCGAVAFCQLLLWLYSGALDPGLPIDELASILRLADVYRIPALGIHCERLLVLHMNSQTVIELLQVALSTHATELEAACLKYAVDNVAAVHRHPSYEECRSMEVVRRIAAAWAGEPSQQTERAALPET